MVEQEDDIVGEARFSQASGTAQVDEKDGDTTFFSEFPAAPGRRWNGEMGMKQRINGNIVSRPELARQPHVCRRVNASKRGRFKSIGRRKFVRALVDTNPAGRTPRPAAAHGNMWSPR